MRMCTFDLEHVKVILRSFSAVSQNLVVNQNGLMVERNGGKVRPRKCMRWLWWYHSLTAHQHQKGHTVPKQVMIATSIQVATVYELHCVRAFAIRPSLNKMSDKTWYPGWATGRLLSCTPGNVWGIHMYFRPRPWQGPLWSFGALFSKLGRTSKMADRRVRWVKIGAPWA